MRGHPGPAEHAFGSELERLRYRHRLKQAQIFPHLGWSADRYSRLESGLRAPVFDDLPAIACGLRDAGIAFTLQDVQRFLAAARQRIAQQRTYKDEHTDDEWSAMFQQTARDLGLLAAESERLPRPHLLDTRHLLPRETWHREVLTCIDSEPPPKLLVLTGAPGVGKSSELSWLAMALSRRVSPAPHLVMCDLRTLETTGTPDGALHLLVSTLSTELHTPLPHTALSLDDQTTVLLGLLEQQRDRLFVIVDHAEWVVLSAGTLASRWERFLSRLLRASHRTTFVLATRHWPGWYGGEVAFVREIAVPVFSEVDAARLLRRLGLDGVPDVSLREIARRVGGIPRGLEWAAALATQPLVVDEWQDLFPPASRPVEHQTDRQSAAVKRLLAEPHLFGGTLGDDIAPVLAQIIERQRLSPEAQWLLDVLSCSPIPLSQPALAAICGEIGTRPLRELRRASLLVSYEQRLHVNALVASATLRQLAPETRRERETTLIAAYETWLGTGDCEQREAGGIVYELVRLLQLHHRLLDAVQYAIRYGWLAFNLGYAPHLADVACDVLQQANWHTAPEQECGGLILRYFLLPYLGYTFNPSQQAADYARILALVTARTVQVSPATDMHVTRDVMVDRMNQGLFREAETLLDTCALRLALAVLTDTDVRAYLVERRANLYGTWCEAAKREGKHDEAKRLREQAIDLYQQACATLTASVETGEADSFLQRSSLKRRLARCLNDLGYHLNRIGDYEQALAMLDRCLTLKKQGYVDPGSLASSYDEQAQSHAGLGHFQEAFSWIGEAEREVSKLAESGHTPSQEERWIYRISRARLLLQRGKATEAEILLKEASSHIHPQRKATYDMLIDESQQELKQGQQVSATKHYQLDWRWIGRYRDIAAFDSLWWLAPSGPFTTEEQNEWDRLLQQGERGADDETRRSCFETLVKQAREREIATAFAQEREPRFWYPVIPLDGVRTRLSALTDLAKSIDRDEPNALVRHFYRDAIAEQGTFLRMIEAVHQGGSQTFWECNQHLHPQPTSEEMEYALCCAGVVIRQGLADASPDIQDLARQVRALLQERLLLPERLATFLESKTGPSFSNAADTPVTSRQTFAPQVVQHFFEKILGDANYEGWSVMLDAAAQSAHIEQGLRQVILPASVSLTVGQVRDYLVHDLGGHVARAVAGERSPLGLFGIGTKNNLTTEEGLALYLERQAAALEGKFYDESRFWLGALTTGMASGVLTHPQSFRSLFAFLAPLLLLYRLLLRSDRDGDAAKARAQVLATTQCLRVYRGVPANAPAGICSTKDAVYLRGYWLIRRAVADDPTVIDRLTVGVVAFEDLPLLAELDLTSNLQPPAKVALDPDLETRLKSFEESQKEGDGERMV